MGFRCAMDGNKPGIAHLISAFTGKKITADDIISLTVQKDVQPMPPSHRVIYDAYAVTKDVDYILEIQLRDENDLANRIRFYIGASDTSELMWGKPYSGLLTKALPTPVSMTCSTSDRRMPLSYIYLPKAPNKEVTGSAAVINMGDWICPLSMPTILVVLPPTSIPITIPIVFCYIFAAKVGIYHLYTGMFP